MSGLSNSMAWALLHFLWQGALVGLGAALALRFLRRARPQARYARSLQFLQYVKASDPEIYTKSGFMVGLGETKDEVVALLEDLKAHDVDAVTIGQYLKPGKNYLDVVEYVHPDVFAEYKALGEAMGFLFVASGPFVRSSYNAKEFSDMFLAKQALAKQQRPLA